MQDSIKEPDNRQDQLGSKKMAVPSARASEGRDVQFPKNHFVDKVIIITGASSGIGRAMSLFFGNQGARVVLASRDKKRLQEIARSIRSDGGICVVIETDVTKHHDCYYLIDKTLDLYGRIDILINNAGISMRAAFKDADVHVLEKLMDTNFWGTVYCTKYALPHLLESHGALVSISSVCGNTPLPGRTGYAASKHALDGFMNTLRIEHLNDGLQVLVAHPGFTASDIRNRALNKEGIPQAETPRNEDKMMTSEEVASEVAKAIIQKKKDIVLTWQGKLITWLYKTAPRVSDKILHWELSKEPDSPF